MAGSVDKNGTRDANLTIETATDTPNVESSFIADTGATSDEEPLDTQDDVDDDDAATAIGVSISHEQIRLTSPRTPAAEKAAAIERAGGFFGLDGSGYEPTLVEEPEETDEEDEKIDYKENDGPDEIASKQDRPTTAAQRPDTEIPERSPRRTPVRQPSPWRAGTYAQWQDSNKSKPGLLDGILFNRRRSMTGPESKPESWQKWLLSNLPSRPKHFSLSSPFSNSQVAKDVTEIESGTDSKRSSSGLRLSDQQGAESTDGTKTPTLRTENEREEVSGELGGQRRQSLQRGRPSYGPPLRRSTSDQSFMTQRTLSTVESLGDDSRFEHVQEMANSRLKAIKDSWQDSSIRLPSMPNFSVPRFAPDFIRDRSGSLNRRQTRRATEASVTGAHKDPDHTRHPENVVAPHTGQSFNSTEAGVSDTKSKLVPHPHFARALEKLEGDIVVLGGYRGSILRSAEPPYRQLWVPVKVGLNLRKADLEVGFEDGDDARASEKIIPGGMLTNIGPVDMARRLFKRLRSCHNARHGKLRVHDYGYDWRLDPAYLSNQLVSFLETLQCNQRRVPLKERGATVIAHSLGGLITRHAVNQRPDLFIGVVYAATPNTCVNILGPMRNGDDVLLSNRVLTAQVNFSIRTSFALLPLDGRCFFDKMTREVSTMV